VEGQIEVTHRFTIPVTIRGYKDIETHADLDSCAELDVISITFALQQRLDRAKLTHPLIEAVNNLPVPTYGVWNVPIIATDSRGTRREFTRPCVAIDRDPRAEGSPVLLSMTTLTDLRVHLSPYNRNWWFEVEAAKISLLTAYKFAKACRRRAVVYALVGVAEELPLPDEDDALPGDLASLPPALRQFDDVFTPENAGILPRHKATDHAIDLIEGAEPPYGPLYPLSQAELGELRRYLDENLAKGFIRPSKSPAGAPILFVPKKDGSLRLCVDYRGLNKVSVKNRFALPLVSEILDRIAGATVFSKIDVKDAYYRIRIKENDEWKTAFRTKYGHYEYLVMPFGLTNAPATFQHYINTALHGLVDVFCVVYLDDILVFSRSAPEHHDHLAQILERMRAAELYANPAKCSFYQEEVEFLGFILSPKGISMDPRRVETIAAWEEPKTYREIQVFLGFCNFYRRFIEGYSGMARPLHDLLKGSVNGKKPGQVLLAVDAKEAFRRLRAAFQEAPLLRHFDPTLPLRIETDASHFAMAGILSQPDPESRWHPVAFWSRKFRGPELNYGTPDKEMMAIVESFKHWRHYVEGSPHTIEVWTDHQNLKTFMTQPRLNGRQARWCMFLTPYDFTIQHRAGKRNPADAPSRRPDYAVVDASDPDYLAKLREKMAMEPPAVVHQLKRGEMPLWEEISRVLRPEHSAESQAIPWSEPDGWAGVFALVATGKTRRITRAEAREAARMDEAYMEQPSLDLREMIVRAQEDDPELRRIKRAVEQGNPQRIDDAWGVGNTGALLYKGRLHVPQEPSLKQELLRLHHDDPLAGHFGVHRTLELLQRKFHWKKMERDVAEYIRGCGICQGVVARRHRPYGSLESLPFPKGPMQEWSMDFVTGLPAAYFRKDLVDAILVIVDRFTKYSFFFPVSTSLTAADLAKLLHEEIELQFGPPRGIVSDRGPVFTSEFWSQLCFHSKVKRRLSTAFHPQTDGQTERMNQTLEHYLRCFVSDQQVNWPNLLKTAQFACNNARNATTGTSPAMALFGYEPDFRLDIGDDLPGKRMPGVLERVTKLTAIRDRMKEQWARAVERYADNYNRRHQKIELKRGDFVGLSTRYLNLKGEKRKLAPRFVGPFRVLQKVGNQAYRLALPEKYSRIHNVFPVGLLEPWKRRQGAGEKLPMPDLEDDDEEWEVEEVRDETTFEGERHYLVKWAGWPAEYNQWVAEADMGNAKQAIHRFHTKQKKRKAKTPS
jgi:transposase InsO family protein